MPELALVLDGLLGDHVGRVDVLPGLLHLSLDVVDQVALPLHQQRHLDEHVPEVADRPLQLDDLLVAGRDVLQSLPRLQSLRDDLQQQQQPP